MTNLVNLAKYSSFKSSFIYLLIILNHLLSNQIGQANQIKPCAAKSNGCSLNQNKVHLPLNAVNSKHRSGYIGDVHYKYKNPINHTDKKLDTYHSKYNLNLKNDQSKNSTSINQLKNQSTTDLPVSEALISPVYALPDTIPLNQSYFLNATSLPLKLNKNNRHLLEDIYGQLHGNEAMEKIEQINSWLNAESAQVDENRAQTVKQIELHGLKSRKPNDGHTKHDATANLIDKNLSDMKTSETKQSLHREIDYPDYDGALEEHNYSPSKLNIEKKISDKHQASSSNYNSASKLAGTRSTPPCATPGSLYCSFKEDYPDSIVAEIIRYYKWPLEKLFRDLKQQVMPKLANDAYGGLVCDSTTRVVRVGWARNTANRWLVVINTEEYQQYVTEIVCREPGSRCNFIAPCYSAGCTQRFNTQKLLVIDPFNKFKGPFLSEFLFPSFCVCYIPEYQNSHEHLTASSNIRPTYTANTNAIKKGEEKENLKIEF